MSLLATDAIVLHVLDYSETSRIFRMVTRDAGIVSALARGARRSRSRFGSALGLFAEGVAQLYMRDNRDLQTLSAFEVMRAHAGVGDSLERFAAASALAELVLRFGTEGDAAGSSGATYEVLSAGLSDIAGAPAEEAREAGLAAVWHLVTELGFAPALARCGACHAEAGDASVLTFSSSAGGVLCMRCAGVHPPGRRLPVEARQRIAIWCAGARSSGLPLREARAHQRLLREFLVHHLSDGRTLRAFDSWERDALHQA